MTRHGFRAALLVSAMVAGAPAFAQTASDPVAPQSNSAPVSQSSIADEPTEGDIVVTANREASLASKTPIALTAIQGDALRNANVTNPIGLGDTVPNLALTRNNGGLQITIRGVTSNDNTEKGDPSAAFLLDGIYLARPQVQEVSFYDINRVEVLRGPQGTLYGRNTTAGVVSVVTNTPSQTFEAAANVTYGNYDTRQADAMINMPISDTLAVRAAGSYDRRDNYLLKGASRFSVDPFKDNASGRVQLLYKPSSDFSILLRADYAHIGGNPTPFVPLSNFFASAPAGTDPRYVGGSSAKLRTIPIPQAAEGHRDGDTYGISGEINWDLGPATLTYLGSYRKFKEDDVSNYGIGGAYYRTLTAFDFAQNSQELRLAIDAIDRLKLQVGGYYFREHGGIDAYFYDIPFIGPIYGFPQHPVTSESYAAFGQAVYSLTDSLRLTGGIRYSHDDKSRYGRTVIQQRPVFNAATDLALLNAARIVSSRVTWRAGIDYDVDARSLAYASIATGYKAGGFNDGCVAGSSYGGLNCASPITPDRLYFNPETLTAYEIGYKTRTSDNVLRGSASAFLYDYKDLQLSTTVSINGSPALFTANAARARIKGVEVEATIAPDRDNRFDLSFAYLDARYRAYLPLGAGGPDYAGRQLDRSPSVVATAGYTHTQPLANGGTIVLNARTRLSDSYVITVFGLAQQYRQPSFTRTDATITYNAAGNRYYLQGFASNLEDNVLLTYADTFGNASTSDPRTYGVRLGFRF